MKLLEKKEIPKTDKEMQYLELQIWRAFIQIDILEHKLEN